MDISDLTNNPVTINKHEKEENSTVKKR